MVVVQILPALNNGGVERGTVEMANFLASRGHTSIVVSAGGIMLDQLSSNVEHYCINVGKKSLSSLFLINKLKQLCIDKAVDVVHARSRLPAWLAYKAIAKIKINKPKFITTIHGLYSVKYYSSIMARGDRVVAVSKTAANYVTDNYSKYLKNEPQIIYRGINPAEFTYGYNSDESWLQKFYENYPELVDHKIVLLPGRLTTIKGTKDLLTWLKSKDNNAKLVLTADPEIDMYAAKLQRWFKDQSVEERIVWVGLQKSMADLYAIADVVISTSIRPESFGRTVIESLAIGTPVIGYDHGGVGEVLDISFPQGKVELGNVVQLSEQINSVLRGKVIVPNVQNFMLDEMLNQTLNVYQEAINA